MSETKPRGRHPKKNDEINENIEKIEMDQKEESKISIQEPYLRMSQIFSKYSNQGVTSEMFLTAMGTSFSNNPFIQNSRLKRINSPITSTDKSKLDKAIKSPDNNEELFRSESQSLYFQNYVYSNLLRLNREIPQYFYYATPVNVTKEDCKDKTFQKEMHFINEILDKLKIRKTCKDIAMDVALEGKRSYIFRTSYPSDKSKVDFCVFQKIPSRWIKYTYVGSDSDYITSLDFMMFLQPGESLECYPPFFKKIWEELVNDEIFYIDSLGQKHFNPRAEAISKRQETIELIDNRYMYWVKLPQDVVFEFGSDNSHALQIPEYIGLFSDLRGLDDYKWLQNQLLSKAVNSVLVGTVPLIKDHNLAGGDQTAISMDSIIGFSDMFSQAVSSNIMPFFAPFTDYKLLSLPLPPDAKEINNTALKNLINTSGMGALISTTDKPSIISVKTAQKLSESKAEYLMLQIQGALNSIIRSQFNLKYQFKVTLWGGLFSAEQDMKTMKEMAIAGFTSVLPRLLSMFNQSMEDSVSINNYIESIGFYDGCKPMTLLTKEKSEDLGNTPQVGRKPVGDNVENDNTEISISQGNNVSDIKEFTSDTICKRCGKELDYDGFLCDECLEEEYEQRLEELEQ